MMSLPPSLPPISSSVGGAQVPPRPQLAARHWQPGRRAAGYPRRGEGVRGEGVGGSTAAVATEVTIVDFLQQLPGQTDKAGECISTTYFFKLLYCGTIYPRL